MLYSIILVLYCNLKFVLQFPYTCGPNKFGRKKMYHTEYQYQVHGTRYHYVVCVIEEVKRKIDKISQNKQSE